MSGLEVSVSQHIDAPAAEVWALLTDVRRIPEYAPNLRDTAWTQGATGPAVGAVFASHVVLPAVLTVPRGPFRPAPPNADTWFYFRVSRLEPERVFEFETVDARAVTATGYALAAATGGTGGTGGTTVTAYTRLPGGFPFNLVWRLMGGAQRARQQQEMSARLDRIAALLGAGA